MDLLKRLLKERWELFIKMRWLKMIDEEIDDYNHLQQKLARQQSIVNALVKRYREIYGED